MSPQPEAAKAIEAILMVAQEPVDPHLLAQLLEVAPPIVEELCNQLAAAYEREDRGFVLAKVAGGYRFQSHGDLSAYVERFVLEGQSARLSAAALETLAIVAYKQPLSRAQVASIRGVNVDGVMRTLLQRGYLIEVGKDQGPGQATLFGTSREFLERLGLNSLDDLPPIADLFPNADIMEALERGLRADPVPVPGDAPSPTEELAPVPSLLDPPEDLGTPIDATTAPADAAGLVAPSGADEPGVDVALDDLAATATVEVLRPETDTDSTPASDDALPDSGNASNTGATDIDEPPVSVDDDGAVAAASEIVVPTELDVEIDDDRADDLDVPSWALDDPTDAPAADAPATDASEHADGTASEHAGAVADDADAAGDAS